MTLHKILDGGLEHQLDLALVEPHPDGSTYETFNVWLVDGKLRAGVNLHIYYLRGGIARERATLFLADGRTYITHSEGSYTVAEEPGGASLKYRCVEPFNRWDYHWHSSALAITEVQESYGLVTDGPLAHIAVDISASTLTEPWLIPLSTGPNNLTAGLKIEHGTMLGKYEQIIRGTGTIAVDGKSIAFSGVGLRGHVRGPRDTAGMGSHAWVCGYFPGGRGFGLKQLFTLDGAPYFSEAYLSQNGRVERATIKHAPRFSRDSKARNFFIDLEARGRVVRIEGENFRTTWVPLGSWDRKASNDNTKDPGTGAFGAGHGLCPDAAKVMSQSCSRFVWDGEEGFGMCEMSG